MSYLEGDLFAGEYFDGDFWHEGAPPTIPLTFTIDAEIVERGRASVVERPRVSIVEVAQ